MPLKYSVVALIIFFLKIKDEINLKIVILANFL